MKNLPLLNRLFKSAGILYTSEDASKPHVAWLEGRLFGFEQNRVPEFYTLSKTPPEAGDKRVSRIDRVL